MIILESHSGGLDVYSISSPSGYPFYPAYVHQPERLAELVANNRCAKQIKNGECVTVSDALTIAFRFNVADYKYAAIASDGLNSFFHTQRTANSKRLETVSLPDVLQDDLKLFHTGKQALIAKGPKLYKFQLVPRN